MPAASTEKATVICQRSESRLIVVVPTPPLLPGGIKQLTTYSGRNHKPEWPASKRLKVGLQAELIAQRFKRLSIKPMALVHTRNDTYRAGLLLGAAFPTLRLCHVRLRPARVLRVDSADRPHHSILYEFRMPQAALLDAAL